MAVLTGLLLIALAPMLILGQKNTDDPEGSMLGEWADFWLVRLLFNLFAYGTFALAGYIFIRWARSTNYVERAGT